MKQHKIQCIINRRKEKSALNITYVVPFFLISLDVFIMSFISINTSVALDTLHTVIS